MMRIAKLKRTGQREGLANRKNSQRNRARLQFEALECRAVPTASLSINGFGVMMFFSQTQGSTVGLSYNAGSDTYTFTSTEGISPNGINIEFQYSQVNTDTATLTPVDPSSLDFTSLEFDQTVENISYNVASLATPTSFSDDSLETPSGPALTDHFVFSPNGTAAASITANVQFGFYNEFPAITINDSNDSSAQTINIDTHQTTIGSVSYSYLTTRHFGSLTIQGGTVANTVSVDGTPGGSATTPATTTYVSNVASGESVGVSGTSQYGPLVLSNFKRGSSVTVGSFADLSDILGNVSITNSFFVALTINNSANNGNSNALLDYDSVSDLNELTGLAPATIAYDQLNLSGLTIETGFGTNILTVNMSNSGPLFLDMTHGLTYEGGGNSSQLVLESGFFDTETYVANTPGSAGGVITLTDPSSFTFPVTFTGLEAVTDLVDVNDYTFPEPYISGQGAVVDLLTGPTVDSVPTAQITNPGSTPAFTTINYANKRSVTIDLNPTSPSGVSSSQRFVYDNSNTAGQQTLDVIVGGANDSIAIEATAPGVSTTISMTDGGDTVAVLGTGLGAGSTSSNFTVDGGPGANTLVINATGTTAAFSPTSPPVPGNGIVTFGAATSFTYLNFTNLSELASNTAPTIVAPPSPSISYYVGVPLDDVVVGAFTDPDLIESATSYSATITWGDGVQSAGTISPAPNSPAGVNEFFVTGSHTYSTFPYSASYQITISVTDAGGTFLSNANGIPVTVQMPAVIDPTTAAPIVTTGNGAALSNSIAVGPTTAEAATAGTLVSIPVILSFTDGNQAPAATLFTAAIDWGDGTSPSVGAITNQNIGGTSFYFIAGSHTYAGPVGSTDTVTVTIYFAGQVQAVATTTMAVNGVSVDSVQGLHALAGTPTGALTVADFTGSPTPVPTGYSAMVDFGDGSPSVAAEIGTTSPFAVATSGHTYAQGGSYTMTVTIRDAEGFVVGTATPGIVVSVTPLGGRLSPQSDTGISNSDGITSDTTPTFVGNTTPGTTVEVFAASSGTSALPGTMIAIGAANSAGYWSATVVNTPLGDGSYIITAEAVNSLGNVLSTAPLGTVIIDTVGPKITGVSFNRFDDTLTVTYQDNLSGLAEASIANGAFYHISAKPLSPKVPVPKLLLPTSILVTPGPVATDPVVVNVVFNGGHAVRGGRYLIVINSGGGDSGVEDVAGNALDGNFYGTLPSGDGLPGGNFAASIATFHNGIVLGPVPILDGYVAPGSVVIGSSAASTSTRQSVKLTRSKAASAVAIRPVSRAIVTRERLLGALVSDGMLARPRIRR